MSESVPGDALYLAVDCSTTAAKAVVFEVDGTVAGSASVPLALSRPGPSMHEQDPREWWTATATAITAAAAQVDAGCVRAVGLTHQRESFACVDAAGEPLRPAILWADGRAGAQIAALGSARVHDLSGKPPDVTPAIYKLAWLRRHEPAVLRDAVHVVDVHAVLAHGLTGRWVSSDVSADTLGLFDVRALSWAPELLELAGVRVDQLPEVVAAGSVVGPLLDGVSSALGLPAGLPLVAGLGDGQAAGLGASVIGPGTAYLNLGTSMVLGVQTRDHICDPAFRTLAGALPGTFTLETILNSAAYLTDWFRARFGDPALAGAPDPALDAAAGALAPGADKLLTLPYWNAAQTPYWDADARGATIGWHGGHTPAHLYRSLLESVGFELRLHLEGLEGATGQPVPALRAMGGGSRSPLWIQLVADITGRTVEIGDRPEVSALGAAVLARARDLGGGAAALTQAAAAMTGPVRRIEPRADLAPAYDRLFTVYRRLYPQLRPIFAQLNDAEA